MKSVGLLVILSLFLSGSAYAERTVWYVHPDSALNTIQAGLDSCAENDIVLVGPGVYYENIIWPNTQGIDLTSEYGPDTTIIDGDSAGRVVNIAVVVDTTTVIRGFTIRNGYVDGRGGGIYCYATSPRIVGNVFTANGAYGGYGGGGAIACHNYSSAVIDSNTIVNNFGTWGGAILIYGNCNATVSNNLIDSNAADSVGGGIQSWVYCNSTVEGNTITNNSARWGGGFSFNSGSSLSKAQNNVISGNTALTMGGGIYCYYNVTVALIDNIVTDNTCNLILYGAGIRISPGTSGVIIHCIISDNNGTGLSVRQSSPDIDSCAIEYNASNGVYIQDGANPTINWCNIVGNQGYGVNSINSGVSVDAENNWWGDMSGPGGVGPGTGNPVSTYVDFDPWLTGPVQGIGVEEQPFVKPVEMNKNLTATIFRGSLRLPEGRQCKVFDITGRVVEPDKIAPGIYFVEIDNEVVQKVVKIR